jgi:sugar/nucleoside kinase (ribokinase family)
MGTISLDHYLETGDVLPGGGVLNMAWHWRQHGRPFRVLTRVGTEDGAPIERFLDGHGIEAVSRAELATPGHSSAIDIEILPDRQPWMDNFVGGVWDDYRTTPTERVGLAGADRLHVVLVEGAIAELERLAGDGALAGVAVSADFLGFRHYTIDRLAATMAHVDLGLIGWPGAEDAPEVDGMRRVAFELGRVLVVTMGARSVRVFDGRPSIGGAAREPSEHRFRVQPVAVAGTTLGCGDAFMAWFLDELWRSGDHAAAVERGMMGGALATEWQRPLPDRAYDVLTPIDSSD